MKRQVSSLDLRICLSEIRDSCIGLRVKKVYSIDKQRLLFKFTRERGTVAVLDREEPIKEVPLREHFDEPHIKPATSTRSDVLQMFCEVGVRVNMTTHVLSTSQKPGFFAKSLNDYLAHATLRSVEQIAFDRVVRFTFVKGDEEFHLVLEMYDKGNLLLLNQAWRIALIWRTNSVEGAANRVDKGEYNEVFHNRLENKSERYEALVNLAPQSNEEKLACVVAAFQTAGLDVTACSVTFCCLAKSCESPLRPKKGPSEFSLFTHAEQLAAEVSASDDNKLKLVAAIANMGDALAGHVLGYKQSDDAAVMAAKIVDAVCFLSILTYLPLGGLVTPKTYQAKMPGMPPLPDANEYTELSKAIDHYFLATEVKKDMPTKEKVKEDAVEKTKRSIVGRVEGLRKHATSNEAIGQMITLSSNREIVDNSLKAINEFLSKNSHDDLMDLFNKERDEIEAFDHVVEMRLQESIVVLRLLDENEDEFDVPVYLNKGNAWRNAEFYYTQKKDYAEKANKTERKIPEALANVEKGKKATKQTAAKASAAKVPTIAMGRIPAPAPNVLSQLGLEAPPSAALEFPLERRTELQLEKVLWFFTTPRAIMGLPGRTSFLVIRPRDAAQRAVFTDNTGKYLSHNDLWVFSDNNTPCIIKTSLVPNASEIGIPIEVAQEVMVFTAAHDGVGKVLARSPEGRVCWGKQVEKPPRDQKVDFLIKGPTASVPPSAHTQIGMGVYFFVPEKPARPVEPTADASDTKYGELQFVNAALEEAAAARPVVLETEAKKKAPQQAKQLEKRKEAEQKSQKRKERTEQRKAKKEQREMLCQASSDGSDEEEALEVRGQNRGEKLRRKLVKIQSEAAAESERKSTATMENSVSQLLVEEPRKVEPVDFSLEVSRLVSSTSDIGGAAVQFAIVCVAPLASLRACKYVLGMDLGRGQRGEAADATLNGIKGTIAKRLAGVPNSPSDAWLLEPYWVSLGEAKALLGIKRDDVLKQLIPFYAPAKDLLMLPPLPPTEA